MIAALLVTVLTWASACADAAGVDWEQVVLSTDRTSYRIGQDAIVTLRNFSGRSVWYSWCNLGVERRTEGEWQYAAGAYLDEFLDTGRFGPNRNVIIGYECDGLRLNTSQSVTHVLPTPPYGSDLEPAPEYRYVIAVIGVGDTLDDRAVIYSNIFAITR